MLRIPRAKIDGIRWLFVEIARKFAVVTGAPLRNSNTVGSK
jgi:hypothetical protein